MTFGVRFAVLALAALAAGSLAGTLVVPWLSGRVRGKVAPQDQANALFHLRMAPTAISLVCGGLVTAAFLIFEPREPQETIGVLLVALSGLSVTLLVAGAARWTLILRDTRRLGRRWMADARPLSLPGVRIPAFAVRTDFPFVSVMGLFRPTLIVAESVLKTCTPEELTAILAHEQGHIARRDNLRRALIQSAPDLLSWLPAARRLHEAWHVATEEAADDLAGRASERGRLLLAQALVTVARLAPARIDPHDLPASALYRGENIEQRVRRLLAPEPALAAIDRRARAALAAVLLAAAVASLGAVQLLVEAAVHSLP